MNNDTQLVVFSHLRWDGVWQRPHQVVSRLASRHGRTFFVEEPLLADVRQPTMKCLEESGVTRCVLQTPRDTPPANGSWLTFGDTGGADHAQMVADLCDGVPSVAWLYSPMALPLARSLNPELLVYDVMDDLAAFVGASAEMKLRQAQALAEADVVFTGGRSLHESVVDKRHKPGNTFCFPSGVDIAHFSVARRRGDRPVAGYVGVIDERLDLELLGAMARALPGWTIRMVGPVAKIDQRNLPHAPNIEYTGKKSYDDLPAIMAEFDVALMPFAISESTRAISPTKTLEYLAAGLPVVSTRIRDVVRDCGDVVSFADDGQGFADLCEQLRAGGTVPNPKAVEAVLHHRQWDVIAAEMSRILAQDSAAAADQAGGAIA
ncbi:MAG: glycosyltransferase [Candidatus Dormibacteria bacterium]